MKWSPRSWLIGSAVAFAVPALSPVASYAQSPAAEAAAPAVPDRATLEKQFSEQLTGSVLIGTFSVAGRDTLKPERYEISSAKKLENDDWLITARIKYGQHDVQVPIVVKVYWADDTPVISLTNLTIPGMGTFTSRVMFYGDRYAGTWQHDAVGGHLWGRVEKAKAATPADAVPEQNAKGTAKPPANPQR